MTKYIDADIWRKLPDDLPYKASVKRVLIQAPVADVVEVKHGEWILKHIGSGHYWECSECEFKNCVMPRTPYCPNCGAKMDGGNAE